MAEKTGPHSQTMSSNTTPTDDVYIVYAPYASLPGAYSVQVPKDESIEYLADRISSHRVFKLYLAKNEVLSLFRCGQLSIDLDSEKLYDEALKWLRERTESDRRALSLMHSLSRHFRNGPVGKKEGKIDVIAVTESFFDVHCVVYVPYGPQAAVYPFRMRKDKSVEDLASSIRDHPDFKLHLQDKSLSLFKYGNSSTGTAKERYQDTLKWLREHSESHMLDFVDRLDKHFPNGPPLSDVKTIDVIAATDSILGGLVAGIPEMENIWTRFHKEMNHALSACAPSKAAKPSEIRGEQMKHPLYNGRPDKFRGPPIAIYHKAFANLKHDLAEPDAIQVTADELNTTHQLFMKSAAFYEKECNRVDETKFLWERLLGQTIRVTTLQGSVASADGCVTVDLEPGQRALLCALEWKLELGSIGDAGYQGACTYRKFLMQKTHARLRISTCNPCLIIGIMGPYFCIMGAVFVDVVIVEPFTEWIFLGGKPDGRVTTVARILKATADALRGLKDYYQNVTLAEEFDNQIRLPSPTMIEGSLQPPRLQYVDRIDPNNMARVLYAAKMGDHDRAVVVKFPDGYSKEAHELLADNVLAPKLHFCSRIKGGLWMVVMDLVEDIFDNDFSQDTLPCGAYEDVERAIGLLHEKGLVFGDLRRPNVIVVETNEGRKGAVLIDFDWCGKEGEAKYPDTLNDTSDINWAPGVERCGLMKKEHDRYCLQQFISS